MFSHVGFFIGPLALRQERTTTSHERSGSLRRTIDGHFALKRHGLRCCQESAQGCD